MDRAFHGGRARRRARLLTAAQKGVTIVAALLGSACATNDALGAALTAGNRPELRIEPIMFRLADGTEIPAERGTFAVPEDRSNSASRRIDIGFIRFRSTNPDPGAPLVYLAGGPGGSGVTAAEGPRQHVFLALRAVGDVIALDQRGTGLSNHIQPCTAERRLDPALVLSDATLTAYYRETLHHCLRQWRAAGVAVNGYTINETADDIEQLRRLLGARQLNLWGISYGTQLALATMRRHPASIGRVVLASAEGTDQNVKLPAHIEAAFARIEGVMPTPGLRQLMRRVHARFDGEPQSFTAAARDGSTVSFRVNSFPLRMMAGILPKNPDGIAPLLGAYLALDNGEHAALGPQIYGFFYQNPLVMTGMPELTDLAAGISDRRLARVRAQLAGSLLEDAINFPVSRLVRMVPGMDLGDRYRREVRSNIPVLLFSGDLDVRTPLEEQREATAGLANLHQVLIRNGGHDLFEAHPDIPALMVDFFAGRRVMVTELALPRPAIALRRPQQ